MDDFEAFDVDCQLELLEDATQNEVEVFAAFSQAKRTMFKRKAGARARARTRAATPART